MIHNLLADDYYSQSCLPSFSGLGGSELPTSRSARGPMAMEALPATEQLREGGEALQIFTCGMLVRDRGSIAEHSPPCPDVDYTNFPGDRYSEDMYTISAIGRV